MYSVIPLSGLPEFCSGDPLPEMLADRLATGEPGLQPGDVVVVTQKIVSKAEGKLVDLATIVPSDNALALAEKVAKDPQLVELVLRESREVVREAPNVLITRHRLGHVMANAGIDASNIGPGRSGMVLLLPDDPDATAAAIATACERRTGVRPGVIISDSFGRPWRLGTVNVAIGAAGVPAVIDQRGEADRDGRTMLVTQIAFADAAAAAAGLAMGEGREGLPVCVLRGLAWQPSGQNGAATLRREDEDLFR